MSRTFWVAFFVLAASGSVFFGIPFSQNDSGLHVAQVTATASADALTFVLEQGPRFAAPTGDVVANPGSYALDPWVGTKLRFNRENTAPLAINTLSEHPDVMHVVHFPLNGHVLAAVGSLSGTQSPDITHAAPSPVQLHKAVKVQASGTEKPTLRTATVLLPRHRDPIQITYEARAGHAILQEDIDLGRESQLWLLGRQGSVSWIVGGLGGIRQPLSVKAGSWWLWPGGVVPFEIDANSIPTGHRLRTAIQAAIADWNQTNVRFVPRNGEPDFVVFVRDQSIPGCGQSMVGRQGVRQSIRLIADADSSCVIHEMAHAVGIFHEQSRMDRDRYVEVLWDNVTDEARHNFDRHVSDGIDLGPYDMTSRMHYRTDSLSKNGLPTLRSRIPGQSISSSVTLSPADLAGLNQLYPRVDCARVPVLHEHTNFAGRSVSLEWSQPNLGNENFVDRGSSLCVPIGWTVTLYADSDYRGEAVSIPGPTMYVDLHRAGPNGKNWGDRVSSVRGEGVQANPAPPECAATPIVVEHDHYAGRRLALTNNAATLHTWFFGDNISSVCVPVGWTLRLYQHTSYKGDVLTVDGPFNLPDLKRESPGGRRWGDLFSSAEVMGPATVANQPPPACSNTPVLFEHDNYRGRPFDALNDVPDLKLKAVTCDGVTTYQSSFNDRASSLCVPAGWTITLYEHVNYGGKSWRFAGPQNWGDLHRNGPSGQDWGDKVSSVRVQFRPAPPSPLGPSTQLGITTSPVRPSVPSGITSSATGTTPFLVPQGTESDPFVKLRVERPSAPEESSHTNAK